MRQRRETRGACGGERNPRQCPHERILLASISKGAGDIKAALAEPGAAAAFRPVAAWLNLSGLGSLELRG